jgi:hypothetical protein
MTCDPKSQRVSTNAPLETRLPGLEKPRPGAAAELRATAIAALVEGGCCWQAPSPLKSPIASAIPSTRSRCAITLLQVHEQQGHCGRRQTRNTRGLPERFGTHFHESLARLVRQTADLGIVEVDRQT